MPRIRLAALAAVTSCALLLGGAGPAAAKTSSQSQPLTKDVALGAKVVGSKSGRLLRRTTFSIDRFVARGGKLYAVGKFSTRLRGRTVSRKMYLPASFTTGSQTAQMPPPESQIPPTEGACPVLYLDLSPITLDLLGLLVRTSRIEVRIEAIPGPGNLLGNLLCGLLGILDPEMMAGATARQQAQIGNAILALAPRRD
jgi:hypothetical protein